MIAANAFGQPAADSLRIAVIGVGSQGQKLINVCTKIPGIRIQAICDIWENYNLNRTSGILTELKQEHATYTSYQDLLADQTGLDAVLIATPDAFHAEQTIACLNAGLHVYCESPMANTVESAKQMAAAAKAAGKQLQIGYQRRSNPYYQYAFAHIINETKMLGTLNSINGQWNRPVQTDRGWPRRAPVADEVLKHHGFTSMQQFRNWEWYKSFGGGPLASFGSHQLDAMNWFMTAPPKAVMASGGVDYYDKDTHEWPDTVMALAEYEAPQGIIRAFYQSINANSNFGYFENFMGDQGTLYVSENSVRVKVYREPNAPDWERWVKIGILKNVEDPNAKAKVEEEKKEGVEALLDVAESIKPPDYDLPIELTHSVFRPHLENFFAAIKGQAQLSCPAEIGLAPTVCVAKIYESIQTGQKIELKPEDFAV